MTDDGIFVKTLFRKQAVYNMLALCVSTIAPLVCLLIAGYYFGSEGLAIVALCAPLFLAASFFGFTISGGAQILCAEFIAKDEYDKVNRVFSASVTLSVIIGIAVFSLLFLFRAQILEFIAPTLTADMTAYYNYFLLYSLLSLFAYIPLFFSRTVGRMEIGLIMTGILTVIGIVSGMILTRFMGVEAIALGQAIGIATALPIAIFMLRKHFRFIFPRELYIKKIFALGSPLGFKRLYVLLSTVALNSLFLFIGGSFAIAVFGVVATINRFIQACASGIAQTLPPLVGVFHQEQDITSIRQTLKQAFFMGNSVIVVIGLVLIVFSTQIARLFGLGDDALTAVMPLYATYSVLLMNGMILASYYNSIKNLGYAHIIPFFQEFLFIFAGAVLLSAHFGTNGIWAAFPISGALTLLVLFLLLAIAKRKNPEYTFIMQQNRHIENDGKHISFSVDNELISASEAAEKISIFCEEHEVSPKDTMLISLSVEEIITLIANHCRSKHFSVSVRILLVGGKVVLRFRNTGEKFDVYDYYINHIADDIEKSMEVVGMKYIVQAAKSVYYRETFGVNSLVVVI